MTFWGGIESRSSVRNGTQVGLEAYIPEGERVLCFSVHLLYEAECVKTAKEDKQVKPFIIAAVGIKIPGSGKQSTQICGQQFVDSENFRRPARNIMQNAK